MASGALLVSSPSPSASLRLAPVQEAAADPPQFSVLKSTEENNKANNLLFYGPYAEIRATLDYSYHCNYTKNRQRLQDSILEGKLDHVRLIDRYGNVCTTPTEPWILFTAGAMGAGKSYTIQQLVHHQRLPLLSFVMVDPDELRRALPEFMVYAQQAPELAGELTRKEAGIMAEILTLAALRDGKNVLVDGSLRHAAWYQDYFHSLRRDYPHLKIGILHVVAPPEAVFARAADRAKKTGRVVPRETIMESLQQVPRSVRALAPLTDYCCELLNAPGASDIEILTPGETWESFAQQWLQTCSFVPGRRQRQALWQQEADAAETDFWDKCSSGGGGGGNGSRRASCFVSSASSSLSLSSSFLSSSSLSRRDALRASKQLQSFRQARDSCREREEAVWKESTGEDVLGFRRKLSKSFSVQLDTQTFHGLGDTSLFWGPYADIRAGLDYTFHSNFKKGRQWLQDAIISDILESGLNEEAQEEEEEERPWVVYVAGVREAEKCKALEKLQCQAQHSLASFVKVHPDSIRTQLPEYAVYVNQYQNNAAKVEELTAREAGLIGEILTHAALRQGRNVWVDASLLNVAWYRDLFAKHRRDYPMAQIAIFHITAPPHLLHPRGEARAKRAGREFSREKLDQAMQDIPKSVEELTPLVDYVCHMENGEESLTLLEGETWAHFRQVFQTPEEKTTNGDAVTATTTTK